MKAAVIALITTLSLGLNMGLKAQDISYPDSFDEPMALFPSSMGNSHFEISSDVDLAQTYFDQGFQLMYAFAKVDAARSFRASQLADPSCAICYWGEAWSWGSYLNGAMTSADSLRALHALQQAEALIDSASTKEADLITSLGSRYIEDYDAANRRQQDQAYANTMGELAAKYPTDLNIQTLYGDALFLLEQRRGYRDLNDPNVIRLHGVLRSVLDRDIRHVGACHLYVHATESTTNPELAAPCAAYLGDAVPGASHLNHMPSHTWNEMGLWDAAIKSNQRAQRSDQKAAIGEGFSIYPTHNLAMLYFAASMDGQGAIAIQAGKDLTKLNRDTSMHVLALTRFGRFDEVLEVTARPAAEINAGFWDFSQAYAALKLGQLDVAKKGLSELQTLSQTTTARYRFHDGKNILAALAGILKGEMAWLAGDMDGAAEAFRTAVNDYDLIGYDEPEPLPFSPRHWLAAAYIELGSYDAAIDVYQQDLLDHPHNGWSLLGISQALTAQGSSEAATAKAAFDQAWQRSEIWLPSSKF